MSFKVVFNGCFGGYGVSELGARWLLDNGANPGNVRLTQSGEDVYVTCNIERHDPLLVRMVEVLGWKANGDSARLVVREISQPLYRIEEYDGAERIEEPDDISWTDARQVEG